VNTKKDPAITRKEEDAALGLGFSPPAKPSQANPKSLLLRLVEIGDHGEKKTQQQNRRKCEIRERSGPRAVFVALTSAEFSRRRWCGERGPVLCGNSIRVSFF
jgi:hypothetical protein